MNDTNNRLHSTYTQESLLRVTVAFIISTGGCCLVLLFRIILIHSYRYSYLVWNLFLAWIPFLLAILMNWLYGKIKTRLKLTVIIVGFVWIIFYPNAPYILTDFIHFLRLPQNIRTYGDSFITPNAIVWYDIVLNSSFAFIGHLIGLISLVIFHDLFRAIFNRFAGWAIAIIAIFLSGYGIYLGRFVRLNSWNIFTHPFSTIESIVGNLFNIKALLFSLCVGFFIFLTYLVVYSLRKLKFKQAIRS